MYTYYAYASYASKFFSRAFTRWPPSRRRRRAARRRNSWAAAGARASARASDEVGSLGRASAALRRSDGRWEHVPQRKLADGDAMQVS